MKLLRATVVFTLGIAIARAITATPSTQEIAIALLAAIIVVAAAVLARKHVMATALLFLLLLGMVRAATGGAVNDPIPWGEIPRNEERVTVEGVMLGDPSPSGDRVRLRLQIGPQIVPDVEPKGGSAPEYVIDVYADRLLDLTADPDRRSNDFRYGDTYLVTGRFVVTAGRNDIAGIISTSSVGLIDTRNGNRLRASTANFRAVISHVLTDSLDSKSGGLAAALLVGDRTKLDPETITDFRASGLSHVLAISGLHIAMVGGIVMAISVWVIGRRRQFYLLAPGMTVWVYAALAGLTPSVTRAAIMFTVYLVARLLGRQRSVLPPLALAAAIMLAVDPVILGSISFQLSFAAVLGIALFSARFAGRGSDWIQASTRVPSIAKRPLTGLIYGMSVSLAATITTAPLVAFHFGEVPIWGIPSTLLLVPVLPLFIGGSVLVVITDLVAGQPIAFAGLISHGIGNYMSFVSNFFAELPIGPVSASGWSMPLIFGWYGVVLSVLNRRSLALRTRRWLNALKDLPNSGVSGEAPRIFRHRRMLYPVLAIWSVAVISLVGFAVSEPKSSELTATFFETNRGDMIFIETPSGARLLVDGGDDPELAVRNIESALPPLDRRIDVLLSTHPDADHLGGLQRIVEQFDVGTIIDSGVPHDSNIYESWSQLIRDRSDVVTATSGLVVALDREVTMRILQTRCVVVECSNFNDEGVVARLDFGEISFLLTGDITSGAEIDLIQTGRPIKSTVLKVGHHGSRTSTTQQFLEAVDPTLAIVTTGIKNQFGHPHEDVIARLTERLTPETVLVTRDSGTLTVTTDGERLWVASER